MVVSVIAVAGIRAANRDPVCAWPSEAQRPLELSRDADRAHLRDDLAKVQDLAAAFSRAVAARPRLSDSIDAIEGARTAPARARTWCEATLDRAIARTHQLSPEQLATAK
jgi:hypothetical protein